jgi:hypothetical protein
MEKLHYIGSLLRLGDSQHEKRLGTFREHHVLQCVKRRSRFALNDICMTRGCFVAHITRSSGFVERRFYFAHTGTLTMSTNVLIFVLVPGLERRLYSSKTDR